MATKKIKQNKTKQKEISLFFIKIYDFLNNYKLTQADKIIYGLIDNICRKNKKYGWCNWDDKTFSDYSNLSTRQIPISLNRLTKNKLIYIEEVAGKRCIFLAKLKKYDDSNFIKVYTSVLMDSSLTINDKLLYSIIRNLNGNPQQYCLLNIKEASQACNTSIYTIYNSLNNLINFSYIKLNPKTANSQSFALRTHGKEVSILIDLWPKL